MSYMFLTLGNQDVKMLEGIMYSSFKLLTYMKTAKYILQYVQ